MCLPPNLACSCYKLSIIKANEKGIYTIAEMKKIRESLYYCTDTECIKNIMTETAMTVALRKCKQL